MKPVLRGLVVTPVVFVVVCCGVQFGVLDWLFQTVWHLLFGWVYYLVRNLPQLAPNPTEFVVAGIALVILVFGCHRLGRWLAPPLLGVPWRTKWTAQVVGLLVLLFACGTAAIGVAHQTAWLARSPESITEYRGGTRDAAGRAQVANNLKQLGLAAYNHEQERGTFPVPSFSPDGQPLHSWHTFLLPHIEQVNAFRLMDLSKPWSDPVNRKVVETRIMPFDHPFAPVPGDGPQPAYLVPNARLLDRRRRINAADFPLGTWFTVLAGEAITDARPWADPLNMRDARRPLGSAGGFVGVPGRPVQVLMADGSVRSITPAGWEPVMRGESPGDN